MNSVLKTATLALAMALLLTGCSEEESAVATSKTIYGMGDVVEESIPVTDFISIDVISGCEVTVAQSDSFYVTLTTNVNLLDYITFETRHGILMLRHPGVDLAEGTTLKLDVGMPEIVRFNGRNKSSCTLADEFRSDRRFTCALYENSSFAAKEFHVPELYCTLEDATMSGENFYCIDVHITARNSTVHFSGVNELLEIDAKHGSRIQLFDFSNDRAHVVADSGSTVELQCWREIVATANANSAVYFKGNPATVDTVATEGSIIQHVE